MILFIRYYHADINMTRKKIKEMIRNGEWNTDEFSEIKQGLLEALKIQHDPVNENFLRQLLKEIM